MVASKYDFASRMAADPKKPTIRHTNELIVIKQFLARNEDDESVVFDTATFCAVTGIERETFNKRYRPQLKRIERKFDEYCEYRDKLAKRHPELTVRGNRYERYNVYALDFKTEYGMPPLSWDYTERQWCFQNLGEYEVNVTVQWRKSWKAIKSITFKGVQRNAHFSLPNGEPVHVLEGTENCERRLIEGPNACRLCGYVVKDTEASFCPMCGESLSR